MIYLYKICVCLFLYVVSAISFAHVAGVTDTAINLNANSIHLVYTLPVDNINEFTEQQKNELVSTITKGFVVENLIDNRSEICHGKFITRSKLDNIESDQFHIRYICSEPLNSLSISYSLFLAIDEKHENYVRLSIAGRSQSFTFSTDKTIHVLPIKKLLAGWRVKLNEHNIPNADTLLTQNKSSNGMGFYELLLQSTHYVLIGVEHILLGYDHVLFLICLLLLPLHFRSVIIIATSFTLAHSITLALSVLDVFSLPASYVEALIALSIVYVAIENIRVLKQQDSRLTTTNKVTVSWQRRSVVTFLFGLLHGFGFSYVLKEIGLGDHVTGSLLFFNLGVELGQLFIIAICFPILWCAFRKTWGAKLAISLSVLVGLMGLFWLIERVHSLT